MTLRILSVVFATSTALVGCGGCGEGGGLFGGSSSEAAAPSQARVAQIGVVLETNNTVVIEVSTTSPAGRCSLESTSRIFFVWDPAQRRAVRTPAVPSAQARRLTGANLGGGVVTYEDVIPGLTIRVLTVQFGNSTVTFTTSSGTFMLSCDANSLSCQ